VTLRRAERHGWLLNEGGCNARMQDISEGEPVLGVRAIPPSGSILRPLMSLALQLPRTKCYILRAILFSRGPPHVSWEFIGVPLQGSHGLRKPAQSSGGVGGLAERVVAQGIARPPGRRGGMPCGARLRAPRQRPGARRRSPRRTLGIGPNSHAAVGITERPVEYSYPSSGRGLRAPASWPRLSYPTSSVALRFVPLKRCS
jgi:hypothetical protein